MLNPGAIRAFKFGWGKILIGSWLILSEVSWYCHLVPKGIVLKAAKAQDSRRNPEPLSFLPLETWLIVKFCNRLVLLRR